MLNAHELIVIPILEGKKIVLRKRTGVATPPNPPPLSCATEEALTVLRFFARQPVWSIS